MVEIRWGEDDRIFAISVLLGTAATPRGGIVSACTRAEWIVLRLLLSEESRRSGTIPAENGMLSEILGEAGWNTYIVGKWHLCPTVEMNLASTRRNWPSGRGFERFYGFLAPRPTSGIRTWSTTTTRWTSRSRRRRATTSPTTSPARRSRSSATPR